MSFTTNIPSSIGANEWTQQHTERQQTERPLDKILAMSLEQDDMDRYITRQQSDDNTGQCFDENWEATNTINWKMYSKVIPKQYTSNIVVSRHQVIGRTQIYDKKLGLDYEDKDHAQIKQWLTEHGDEIIQTSQFFLRSYPELAECHH